MVAINKNYGENPLYGGRSEQHIKYDLKKKAQKDSYPSNDCANCGKIPVRIAIAEVKEGENYVGAFNFRPVFTIPEYYNTSSTVQPNIGVGYVMQFNPNIMNLLRKMKENPKGVHLDDRVINTDFMAFDFSNGQALQISQENAKTLSGLAMGGVEYIFENPESTRVTDSPIGNFLGMTGMRFSATNICIPSNQELMSFLREQWRRQ